MKDLIERQAAIDALDVLCQEHRYRIPGKRETYSEYNEAWQDALDRAECAIGNLPSVQPDSKESSSTHKALDTISRQAAIDALRVAYWDKNIQSAKDDPCIVDAMTDWAIRQVKALPPEQPEIIRCRDCRHYQFADNRAFGMPVKMCEWFGFEDVDDNDFCSRAERRTDGTE